MLNLTVYPLPCPNTYTGSHSDGWLNLKAALPVSEVPEKEDWRPGLLDCLLVERAGLEREGKNTRRVVAMIS